MSNVRHLINVLFLGALCASLGLVCGTNVLAPRVAALEAIVSEQLVVVDANGTVLGSHDGSETVVLDLEGLPLLPVSVRRNLLVGSERTVYFFSSDCSGDPYFARSSPDPQNQLAAVLPRTVVLGQAETIFYSDLDTSPEDLGNIGSYLDDRGCSQANFNTYLSPGFRASLEPFTPPYSVVTRGELAAP